MDLSATNLEYLTQQTRRRSEQRERLVCQVSDGWLITYARHAYTNVVNNAAKITGNINLCAYSVSNPCPVPEHGARCHNL